MESNNGGCLGEKKATRMVNFSLRNSASAVERDKTTSLFKQGMEICKKVRERLNSPSDYQMGFLKHIHACSTGKIGKIDLKRKISGSISKYPDLIAEFDDFVNHCESESSAEESQTVNLSNKSIQELDLSKCLEGTPNYRLLPEDYQVAMETQRSDLGAHDVLNDFWVCTPVGNRNYSPKIRGRNMYEQALDRCEGHQYEFDMLLNKTRSAAERVEELVDGIKEKKIDLEGPFRIEDHLSVLSLRCIERLYDEQGHEMLEMLKEKPTLVLLSVILSRLKQKIEKLTESKTDLDKVWARVYAKNHHKSLEQRQYQHF